MDQHSSNKALIAPLRDAMYNFSIDAVRSAMAELVTPDAIIHLCHPLGEMIGPDQLFDNAYSPLAKAFPDLERRDYIVIAGPEDSGANWVGCAGTYVGTFKHSWLGIPATNHLAHMRFHEFYRIENEKIVEIQAIWDIPELMMQADAWPMAPSLGRKIWVPAPATQDGITSDPYNVALSEISQNIVMDMNNHMVKHPSKGGPEVMEMDRFWHPNMNWYGPAGIGTARGIEGFRKHHQIPFLKAMPDRGQFPDEAEHHFFADGKYVAVTGWPNMVQTIRGDGWLGLAPTGQKIALRSLDFWRVENNFIRENWVLVDLLDVFHQVGIDVFARMHELGGSKNILVNDEV